MLKAASFFFIYVHLYSLNVSDSYVSIIRIINCINIIPVYVTMFRWPSGTQVWMELEFPKQALGILQRSKLLYVWIYILRA